MANTTKESELKNKPRGMMIPMAMKRIVFGSEKSGCSELDSVWFRSCSTDGVGAVSLTRFMTPASRRGPDRGIPVCTYRGNYQSEPPESSYKGSLMELFSVPVGALNERH